MRFYGCGTLLFFFSWVSRIFVYGSIHIFFRVPSLMIMIMIMIMSINNTFSMN